uniref:Uncharacterized protein LOC102805790 n=1 Tax=Saccoglossus kowalevskii TaxID=10224 RepID=A0ABM0MU34_SACKO|nr:PREDICTED: uncharacterized protein LOC102805790 [Saccoglossus kowalevskii]
MTSKENVPVHHLAAQPNDFELQHRPTIIAHLPPLSAPQPAFSEKPKILQRGSWTQAAPFKELKFCRHVSDSIANNYSPTARNLTTSYIYEITRKLDFKPIIMHLVDEYSSVCIEFTMSIKGITMGHHFHYPPPLGPMTEGPPHPKLNWNSPKMATEVHQEEVHMEPLCTDPKTALPSIPASKPLMAQSPAMPPQLRLAQVQYPTLYLPSMVPLLYLVLDNIMQTDSMATMPE